MSRAGRGRTKRKKLRGWFKWLPFLFLPFSILFTEIYLQTQRLNNDYEISAIREEINRLDQSIGVYETEKATLGNLSFWQTRAEEMKFVRPVPNQVETLYTDDAGAAPESPAAGADNETPPLEPLSLP